MPTVREFFALWSSGTFGNQVGPGMRATRASMMKTRARRDRGRFARENPADRPLAPCRAVFRPYRTSRSISDGCSGSSVS